MLTPFELYMPKSLNEAISQYAELGNECKILAGGTDVLVEIHGGHKSPACLMDIKNLPELKGLEYTPENGLVIGALTTHHEVEKMPAAKSFYPALVEGVSQVGSVQTRHRGTVGGNICNAVPSGDSLAPLLALNARLLIQGPQGKREVFFEDFFLGSKKTVLQNGELLTHILVPTPSKMSSSAYTKFTRRGAMDLALLGTAVSLTCNDDGKTCKEVRIALATAAPTPMRAKQTESFLKGKELTEEVLKEAGELASAESKPRSSWRASAEYRHEVLKAIVPRTIGEALKRIQIGVGHL